MKIVKRGKITIFNKTVINALTCAATTDQRNDQRQKNEPAQKEDEHGPGPAPPAAAIGVRGYGDQRPQPHQPWFRPAARRHAAAVGDWPGGATGGEANVERFAIDRLRFGRRVHAVIQHFLHRVVIDQRRLVERLPIDRARAGRRLICRHTAGQRADRILLLQVHIIGRTERGHWRSSVALFFQLQVFSFFSIFVRIQFF